MRGIARRANLVEQAKGGFALVGVATLAGDLVHEATLGVTLLVFRWKRLQLV